MNNKVSQIAHGKFHGASGGTNNANTFFKSANGGSQLANQGTRQVWNADGDPSQTTTQAAPAAATDGTGTLATTPPPCGCAKWHKPGCFVGGLLIGALVTYLIVKKQA